MIAANTGRDPLDPGLVDAYLHHFLGYGNPAARYWLIGTEHGGGGSRRELESRLEAWDGRGRREFEHAAEYHDAFNYTAFTHRGKQWFGQGAALQSTWSRLIRVMLNAERGPSAPAEVRQFQAAEFGTPGGLTAAIELSAWPCPKQKEWPQWASALSCLLTDRETCLEETAPGRIARIQSLIDRCQPRAVICYGVGYRSWWSKLAGGPIVVRADGVERAMRGRVPIYVIRHPAAPPAPTNNQLDEIGRLIGADAAALHEH